MTALDTTARLAMSLVSDCLCVPAPASGVVHAKVLNAALVWAEWEVKLSIPEEKRHSRRMHERMFWVMQASALLGANSNIESRE